MKSKLGLIILLGTFIAQANAQAMLVNVFPLYTYNTKPVNYMMGVVRLPNGTVSTNTNIITGNVVGTTTATSCAKYVTTFHKLGDKGADVVRLQKFLNQYNGANLNEKGFYGPATMQEVKNFQYAYGIKPTGAQYEKTTEAINLVNCGLISKKDRVIYKGQAFVQPMNFGTTATVSAPVQKIYPNTSMSAPTGIIKTVPVKTPVVKATNTNSFFGGMSSDFDKIKENYKAYALVLVLVLALFWFLRKAATE